MWAYNYSVYSDELYHYGIPGMRWGHRKAQLYETIGRTGRRIKGSKVYAKGSEIATKASNTKVGKSVQNAGRKYYDKKRAANNKSYVKSVGKGVARGVAIKAAVVGSAVLGATAIAKGANLATVTRVTNSISKIGNLALTANAVATVADTGMTYVNRKYGK